MWLFVRYMLSHLVNTLSIFDHKNHYSYLKCSIFHLKHDIWNSMLNLFINEKAFEPKYPHFNPKLTCKKKNNINDNYTPLGCLLQLNWILTQKNVRMCLNLFVNFYTNFKTSYNHINSKSFQFLILLSSKVNQEITMLTLPLDTWFKPFIRHHISSLCSDKKFTTMLQISQDLLAFKKEVAQESTEALSMRRLECKYVHCQCDILLLSSGFLPLDRMPF